jgi:glucan phosphorylase
MNPLAIARKVRYTQRASKAMQRKRKSTRGGKAASIYDVAKEARVSVFTVSAVVNHKSHVGKKLRERVDAAIRKLNYRPNQIGRAHV